uniref:Cytochrome p450 n=1 Tax=Croton stellatopilosus TaxID=431156 RepID=A0A3G2CJY6_9ROSI|nr:cytochrome p450 [Croton stellatopilosus]
MKLPLIGNLHNLAGAQPHHALTQLAKQYGPLMHLQLGEISAIVVSNPRMAQEIMKTHDIIFADRPEILASKIITYGGQDIAFSKLGEYWKQMKRISLTELLGPKTVQSFASLRENEVEKLIHSIHLSKGKPVNFTEKIFNLTNVITCKAAFGDECKDQDVVIALTKEATTIAGGFGIEEVFPSMEFLQLITGLKGKLEKLRDELGTVFGNIIDEHKKKMMNRNGEELEKEDLVDVLLKLQGSGRLQCPVTNNSLKAVVLDLFVAGTDTSSTTVEWAMSEMMKNPRILKKAQAEVREAFSGKKTIREEDVKQLKYLPLIIKETLRLHPPAPLLLPRESREACMIEGYEIPIKSKVIVNAWAIARDPEAWNEPDKFMPERFMESSVDFKGMDFEFVPFGAGRRICPGIAFGLANIELPLARILYHFDWKLPDGITSEEMDMTEAFGATVGRKNNLYLVPIPYIPQPHSTNHTQAANVIKV